MQVVYLGENLQQSQCGDETGEPGRQTALRMLEYFCGYWQISGPPPAPPPPPTFRRLGRSSSERSSLKNEEAGLFTQKPWVKFAESCSPAQLTPLHFPPAAKETPQVTVVRSLQGVLELQMEGLVCSATCFLFPSINEQSRCEHHTNGCDT